jgi:hypothetical protein
MAESWAVDVTTTAGNGEAGAEVVGAELDTAETHRADPSGVGSTRVDAGVYARTSGRNGTSTDAAMERIAAAEAEARLPDDDRAQQHGVYEKTFDALEDVTPDDDEGSTVVSEWIVEQIRTDGKRPSSRAVRRRAREYCEANGHEISDDDWLGA